MEPKKRVFIYPVSSETYKAGANNYISNLISHLSTRYTIINRETKTGLLDLLLQLHKCDIIYFNWIEDLPHRRLGFLQIPLLFFLLLAAKALHVKIVWFVHNNISHNKKFIFFKRLIIAVLKRMADVIVTHSDELTLRSKKKIYSFHHPVDTYQPLLSPRSFTYDILIWGTVSPYKGISEFIEYAATSPVLKDLRVLIAGKFNSPEYYAYIDGKKPANFTILNKLLSEEELIDFFAGSRYVLFTYNSSSVLSSASLCKTLSFGKEIIGPYIGSFKELGNQGLLYNYNSLPALELLLNDLKQGRLKPVDQEQLANYIRHNSWDNFTEFLYDTISTCYKK